MGLGIFARSSTPLKRGLMIANGVGIVDSDYCGPTDEVKIAVMNFTDAPVPVNAGDRIAQGLLLAAPQVTGMKRPSSPPSRGEGLGQQDVRTVGSRQSTVESQSRVDSRHGRPPTADASTIRNAVAESSRTPQQHAMHADAGITIRRRYQMRSPYQ